MTTETQNEQLNEDAIPSEAPKAAEDTTMEGDFSPAEKEGLAEYQKMLDAMDKGEEYTPAEASSDGEDEADAGKQVADESKAAEQEQGEQEHPTEEELSAMISSGAEAVAAAEEALKAAEDKAIALGDQLENGEISQAKYDIEYRRVMREIDGIEVKLAEARVSLEQYESAAEQASVQSDPWYQAATSFLAQPGNDIFNDGEHHEGLKQAIAFAAGLKQNAEKQPADIIRIAASTYRSMAGLDQPAAKPETAKPAPKPAPNIPPTLGQMQPAVPNSDDSPFSHLANLSGPAFEDAYNKLSQAQRDAFMDSLAG